MDFIYENNRIYLNDDNNNMIAEITFPNVSKEVVNINHTYVDKSLRGQGVADKLMTSLIEYLKENNIKANATCSYAVDWLNNHPEHNNLKSK
jgi:uncharacterized protein